MISQKNKSWQKHRRHKRRKFNRDKKVKLKDNLKTHITYPLPSLRILRNTSFRTLKKNQGAPYWLPLKKCFVGTREWCSLSCLKFIFQSTFFMHSSISLPQFLLIIDFSTQFPPPWALPVSGNVAVRFQLPRCQKTSKIK